ncbi:MAG TPA: hypothetical protein DCL15_15225 [Chloroflexi bacterium]|nr:hypothetical protein [Chloroflexota bacterium]HHW86125.1 DUF4129 domain-containing protein [Chloroflexota bacterium]
MTAAPAASARLTWLLAVLLATMRVAWLWPWLLALGAWMAPSYLLPVLPMWSLLALLLGGRVVARLAAAHAPNLRQARIWIAVLSPPILLLLIWWQYGQPLAIWDVRWLQVATGTPALWAREMAPAVLAFFVAAWLWLRGVLDAGKPTDHEMITGAFVTGSVAFAALLVGSRLANAPVAPGAQWWLIAFVATGMAGLALASVERSLYAGGAGASVRLRLNRYWLVSVAFVIAGVILLALVASALIAPETVAQLLGLLSPVVDILSQVLLAVLYAAVYVLFWVLSPLIEWLRRLIASLQAPEAFTQSAEFQPLSPLFLDQASGPSADLVEPLRWGVIVAVIVAAAIIFALALRLFNLAATPEVDETRESILSRALLNAQLRALWARLRQSPRSAAGATFLPLDDEAPARRRIRAHYQNFLAAMAARRQPRPPGATPQAYAAELTELTAEQELALHALTTAYVAVRYGDALPDAAMLAQAQVEWSIKDETTGG